MRRVSVKSWKIMLVLGCAGLALGLVAALGSRGAPDMAHRGALNPPIASLVMAHSDGLISPDAAISVVLAAGRDAAALEGVNPFTLYPPLAGSVSWSPDGSRADFTPDKPLKPGSSYRVRFDFAALGEEHNGSFSFDVRAAVPVLSYGQPRLSAQADGSLALEGSVSTADQVSAAELEKTIQARLGSRRLTLSWSHEGGQHRYTASGIERGQKASRVELRWDAQVLGASTKGKATLTVPAEGSFELLSAQPASADSGRAAAIDLDFSEAVDPSQDFRGLIRVNGISDLRFEARGGTVSVYPAERWPDAVVLTVDRGIASAGRRYTAEPVSAELSFDWEKPESRFPSGGVIVPTSQGTRVVLETMNLASVYVEALRVYGDNMLQFLQVNELNGTKELKRVGDVVWSSKIDLGWNDGMKNQWTPYALDLSPLLAKHPDGMFQLRVVFGHEDIRYVCPNPHPDSGVWSFPKTGVQEAGESSYWDWYETWFDWDEYYRYRDDPCTPYYYLVRWGQDRTARRNVLVSDVGIMAKKDAQGQWHVTATDLRSAKPLPGASVALYSYSLRQLAQANADSSGIARLSAPIGSPEATFLVVKAAGAKTGRETGYLKLDSSQTLAVSHFDVGGETAVSGIKGFIYGERGVWRPGDDIHLTFILQDAGKKLPAGHPVSFELENPLGQVTRQATYTTSVNGFYYMKTGTEASSPTGTWTARVRVGGQTFTKAIKVETVMPNRLKLGLDWGSLPYLSADSPSVTLKAAWLHGAPAPDLKADVSVVMSASAAGVGDWKGFSFQDPFATVPSGRSVLFDGYLDRSGQARFSFDLETETPLPGPLTASLMSRAFERSGLFSSESFSATYHPYGRYVGLKLPAGDARRGMLLTDQDHQVEIILTDRDGKLVKDGQVRVSLYKLEWRWWWEKGDESLAEYQSDVVKDRLRQDTLSVKDGRVAYKLRLAYPEWGRFLIRVEDISTGYQGHAAGSEFYMDWPGWAGRSRAEGGGSAVMLSLSTDKERYNVGDTVSLSFPSNKEGRAFITIERAGTILEQRWVDGKDGTTTVQLKASAAMAPNVYAHVSFIQPHLQTGNDLPIRLYGVVPLLVENPESRIEPVISAPSALAPYATSSITVSEKSGRAMTYTLAVVDEGLLGITRYVTPNPWDSFYRKEASSLLSYDLYKDVAGAYTGKLQTMLSIGGSEFGDGGGTRKVSRFPPVVRYFGPFSLSKGEKRAHSLELGPYVGAVRFMVVAGTPEGAYGKAEVETPVRAELMPFITAPRVIGPRERLYLPVTVFGFMGKDAKGTVSLRVEGPAAIEGESEKTLFWPEEGEQFASFQILTKDQTGALKITATVTGPGGRTASQTIELPVRSAAVPVSSVSSGLVPSRGSLSIKAQLPGLSGSNEAWLELSTLPPIDLSSRLTYLLAYPHGCGEQTTSTVFPQLFLEDAMSLSPEQTAEVRANVGAGIAKLAGFQTTRGGFVFWPGQYEESPWLSAYITHFYVMAKRQGYSVNPTVLEKALDYLRDRSTVWSPATDYDKAEQAYRLYVLALAGKADVAAMNRFAQYGPHKTAAHYQLAAAYALAGMKDKAAEMVRSASIEVAPYSGMEYVYGSVMRDTAIVLDAFNALGDQARALPLFKKLAESLSASRWWSTQELSYSLIACLPYMKRAATGSGSVRYSYDKGSGSASVARAVARIPLTVDTGTVTLSLTNEGSQPVYARVITRGVPLPGGEPSKSEGLSLSVAYLDSEGASVDPDRVALGEDLVAVMTVRNISYDELKDIALTFRAPAGWEISNMRLAASGDEASDLESSPYDYQDIRDDRVMTYFPLLRSQSKSFRVYLNKTYDGEFFLPAITVEAMYKPEVFALIPGRRLSRPGQPARAQSSGTPSRNIQP